MPSNSFHETAILATLEAYANAYNTHDIDAIMALWADDPDVLLIGTGPDEKRIGTAEVRRQFAHNFARAKTLLFAFTNAMVSIHENSAIVVANADARTLVDDQIIQFSLRMTIILKYSQNRWWWVHRHAATLPHHQHYE